MIPSSWMGGGMGRTGHGAGDAPAPQADTNSQPHVASTRRFPREQPRSLLGDALPTHRHAEVHGRARSSRSAGATGDPQAPAGNFQT